MANIKTFKDLKVWESAHQLALMTYAITQTFPSHEKFGLVSQMRRAAVSIPSNIVEGLRRKSLKDSLHFYNIADASPEELKYQLLISQELKFITNDQFEQAETVANMVGKMLFRWIESQKQNTH